VDRADDLPPALYLPIFEYPALCGHRPAQPHGLVAAYDRPHRVSQRHHPDTDQNRCAWCGQLETPAEILLPMGVGARHSWLHDCCWAEWREGRRAEAIAMLAGMGIAEPSA
jgi:hypothetical protein